MANDMTDGSRTSRISPLLGILFASVGYLGLQFILTPIRIRVLTTILTKEQYGTLTLVITTISCLTTIVSLGSFEYLLRKMPGRGQDEQLALLGVTLRFFGGLCLLVAAAGVGVLLVLFRQAGGLTPPAVLACGVGLIVHFYVLMQTYWLLARSSLVPFRVTQFFYSDFWFVSVVAVGVLIPLTMPTIIWTWALWLLLVVAVTRRWFPAGAALRSRAEDSVLREILAFGVPLLPMIFGEWLFRLGDRYIVLAFLDIRSVANYTLCMNIAMIVYMVGLSLISLVLPEFNMVKNTTESGDPKTGWTSPRMRELFTLMLRYSLVLSLPGGIALFLVGSDILAVLSDPEFHDAAFIFPWAAPVSLFFLLQVVCNRTLMAFDRSRLVGSLTLAAAGINIGLNLWLVPILHERGAALATVMSLAFLACCSAWCIRAWRWG